MNPGSDNVDAPTPTDTDSEARVRRVIVAGHSEDAETAALGLTDPSPAVRAAAVGAMARIIALTPDQITRAMADEDPLVRRRACEAAPQTPRSSDDSPTDDSPADDSSELIPVGLLRALTDPESLVVEMAAWALGELEPPGAGSVAALAEVATSHDDPLCRESAVAALGSLGLDNGLPAILSAMSDIATVRRRAVLALAPFDSPEVEAALRSALEDRDWQVRQGAEDLLGESAPGEADPSPATEQS